MKILIVDDERPARSELEYLLSMLREDAEFIEASSGEEALCLMIRHEVELAFVDINLGDIFYMAVLLKKYLSLIIEKPRLF